jgi:hypothetical protein
MGFIINFVLLLLWFGIYLYLVTANKNLTKLLRAMLSFNPYYWSALHLTRTPTFGEFMHIIAHNMLIDEHMWAHPCYLIPPQVKNRYHRMRRMEDAAMCSWEV